MKTYPARLITTLLIFTAFAVLSSTIIAGSGDPLKGLNVTIERHPPCGTHQIATDANGAFSFVRMPKGNYSFEIKLDGTPYTGCYCRIVSSKYESDQPSNGSKSLAAQKLTLVVEIVRPTGKPFASKPLEFEMPDDMGELVCYVQEAGKKPPQHRGKTIPIVWTSC